MLTAHPSTPAACWGDGDGSRLTARLFAGGARHCAWQRIRVLRSSRDATLRALLRSAKYSFFHRSPSRAHGRALEGRQVVFGTSALPPTLAQHSPTVIDTMSVGESGSGHPPLCSRRVLPVVVSERPLVFGPPDVGTGGRSRGRPAASPTRERRSVEVPLRNVGTMTVRNSCTLLVPHHHHICAPVQYQCTTNPAPVQYQYRSSVAPVLYSSSAGQV